MSFPPSVKEPGFVTVYRWLRHPFELMEDSAAKLGPAFSFELPGLPKLAVFSEPDVVKHVFADTGDDMLAGQFNRSIKAFLGDKSVLMVDKETHLRKRRLLLPPFHGERMTQYGDVMLELANEVIDAMPLGDPFSLHERLNQVALHVIVRNVFGVEKGPRETEIRKLIADALELLTWSPLLVPAMQFDFGNWSPWGRAMKKKRAVDQAILEEIRRRRAEGTEGRNDILSLLLRASESARAGDGRDSGERTAEPMSDEELLDELITLLVAGHETTATAIAWAFRWILATPEVDARLLAELGDAAAQGPITSAKIASLPYLDATMREALRLQPVVPLVGRILDRPMTVGGYDLPKGAGVVCSIYLAHRRPETYPDPSRFLPERFLGKKLTPAEFFPFGGGIRRCIGMAFALYEMKMVSAALLLRTRLALASKRPIEVVRRAITLTPSEGLRVKMVERRPWDSATRAA